MLIVMDMSTGQRLEQIGGYSEEVLHANWMPQPALQLGLQSAIETRPRRRFEEPRDIDAFLNNMYLCQE
ncbi:MAG: hypothetical protein PHU46_17820 [Rhodocyclaceae bacterium]|nr:hypothetical protein [Rhodocyclaceae bacterium]